MIKEYPNFESAKNIASKYTRFSLDTHRFSNVRGGGFCGGVPLVYDNENNSLYVDSSDSHSLIIGASGSLKSRAVIMPTVKILGYAGESLIINDVKGELYAKSAAELKENGYNIVVINLRNPAVGNAWNPLFIPYSFYINGDIDRAAEFANDISQNLALNSISTKDPYWDFSAASLLFSLIIFLFKWCKEKDEPIEAVNINNVIKLRHKLFDNVYSPEDSPLWKYASSDSLIANSMSGTIFAPTSTRNCILSVFDQKLSMFSLSPALTSMLSNNDFDIADIGNKKTAVYLITPDEKTTLHSIVSLYLSQSYQYLVFTAQNNLNGQVKNRINYIVDEFSALPTIRDLPAMISASRSRNIRWMLVIQSKNQLVSRYHEESQTIIGNATNWIYLYSRELELLNEISQLCGTQKSGSMPNISVYELQHLSKDNYEALILCGRSKAAVVNLRDIDKLDEKIYPFLDFKTASRLKLSSIKFELPQDVEETAMELPKAKEIPDVAEEVVESKESITEEKFELICMDIIEEIIKTDKTIEKEQALEKAKLLLSYKQAFPEKLSESIEVYERVVAEFEKSTDDEVRLLRNQIFNQ